MNSYKRTAKVCLIITYILMAVLLALVVALPYLVTWYVETRSRNEYLGTVVMLTCYPCVPFAATALLSLRKFLSNITKDKIAVKENARLLLRLVICCGAAGVIMMIAGIFYMPFFIAGGAALVCSLVVETMREFVKSLCFKNEESN